MREPSPHQLREMSHLQFLDGWLFCAEALSQETTLGEKLADHDRADWVRLFMRFEFEEVVPDRPQSSN